MKHKLFWLLLGFAALGCQTTKVAPKSLPRQLQQMFGDCHGLEGAVYLKAKDNDATLFAAQTDWVAKTRAKWVIESYSSFGQTIGRLEGNVREKRLIVSLPSVDPNSVAVDAEGKISYRGYYVGVVLNELPCLLAGLLPRVWLGAINSLKVTGSSAKLEVEHQDRTISVVIENFRKRQPSFCSYFLWSNYLGIVKNNFEYCILGESKQFVIKFDNGVLLEWSPIGSI